MNVDRTLNRDMANHLRFDLRFDPEKQADVIAVAGRMRLRQTMGTHGKGWHYTREELDKALDHIAATQPALLKH